MTNFGESHFMTLQMSKGFLRKDEINVTNARTMPERLEAVLYGELAVATLSAPWIGVVHKQGSGSSWRASPPTVRRQTTSCMA